MLKNTFDPRQAYRYVRYGRMSTDMQNPRSPEQQFDTINRTLGRQRLPWIHVADYRDDAISGLSTSKRPQFRRMLADLKSGTVQASLILVDSLERFGRAAEIAGIRIQLQSRHKIYVMTADSQFADPTTSAGRALAMVETIRSTEDGRIKAHNVLRGKRDLATRGRWPGGPMPLGYRLRSVLVDRRGRQEVDGHILEHDPATSMIPRRIYALALETGWGTRRLARALNDDPAVPDAVKPISAERVRQVLDSSLYTGTLTYGRCRTGIVEDRLVREPVDPGEETVVDGFCEPLVDREVAEAVRQQRRSARQSRPAARPRRRVEVEAGSGPTMTVVPRNHLLTGLARCGECGGSMRISSSTYRRNGKDYHYAYYGCWRQPTGQCGNSRHVNEVLLREAVIARLRSRLFPPPGEAGGTPAWLVGLAEEVRRELQSRSDGEGNPRTALLAELTDLGRRAAGWSQSLANPDLPPALRSELEGQWSAALSRRGELDARLARLGATSARIDATLDIPAVLERLRRLPEVLAGGNITEGNRALGRHIEGIVCFADGRIEMRAHRLGLFEGVSEWFPPATPSGPAAPDDGLYWSDPIELGQHRRRSRPCWASDHAAEVLAKRREAGWTVKRLTEHFGRCRQTIDKALEIAEAAETACITETAGPLETSDASQSHPTSTS